MKRIILVRHAHSSWHNDSLPDIDKPLDEKGYQDAHEMGRYLSRKDFSIKLVLASPAVRTLTTALIFAREGLFNQSELRIIPALYESTEDKYFERIKGQDDNFQDLFIFGHNPTISLFHNLLVRRKIVDLSPCQVVIIDCSVSSWSEVEAGAGKSSVVVDKTQG